jgi:hypothetical protein
MVYINILFSYMILCMNRMNKTTRLDSYHDNPSESLLKLCSETIDIGINSYNTLEKQNEQLTKGVEELDEIHHDLRVIDKKLDKMESFWLWLIGGSSSVPVMQSKKSSHSTNHIIMPSQMPEKNNNYITSNDKYLAQQDADIDKIMEMTRTMKVIATNMNKSLDTSSQFIEKIDRSSSKAIIKEKELKQREKDLMI